MKQSHIIPWGPEYRCQCGALVMRRFDAGYHGVLYDNDPSSQMGLHVCPAQTPPLEWYEVWAPCCGAVALQQPDGSLVSPVDGRTPHRCPARVPEAALSPELQARSLEATPGPPKKRRSPLDEPLIGRQLPSL